MGRVTADGRLIQDFSHVRNWESIIGIFENSTIPDYYKKGSLRALVYLRKILGESWPTNPETKGHPLLYILGNPVPWCAGLVSEIAIMISDLEGIQGFEEVKRRLKGKTSCNEALSVVHAASLLGRCGTVKALWRKEGGRDRDVVVEMAKIPVFAEITNPRSTFAEKEMQTYETITMPIHSKWMGVTGRIQKPLSKARLKEARSIILKAISEIERTGYEQHVKMKGAFDLTITPKISSKKSLEIPISHGKDLRMREIDRIRSVIHNKADRYSRETSNAIMIYNNPLYFADIFDKNDFAELIVDELEETVYDQKHLSFLALILIGIGAGKKGRQNEVYAYSARSAYEMVHQRILIIKNRYASHKIPDTCYDLLIKHSNSLFHYGR